MTAAALARVHRAAEAQQRRQACATCGDVCAPFACGWACEVATPVWPASVEVGDMLITPQSKRLAPVTHVNRLHHAYSESAIFAVEITVEYRHGRRRPPYPQFTYLRRITDGSAVPVAVLRPGVCGARCCEAHVREVGDGRHYCRAHWGAWMEAAAQ